MLNLKSFLKAIVFSIVIFSLAVFIDEDRVLVILSNLKSSFIIAIVIISVVTLLLQSIRFRFLFEAAQLSTKEALKFGLIGFSFNNLLPANLGSDIYKFTQLKGRLSSKQLILKTIFDRFLGLFTTMLLGLLFFYVNKQLYFDVFDLKINIFYSLLLLSFFLFACLVIFIIKNIITINQKSLVVAVLISILFSIFQSFKFNIISTSLGAQITIVQWFGIIAIVQLFALIPISVGNLGIFEAGLVLVVGIIYVSPEMGLAIGVVNRLTVFLISGLGLAFWFREKNV